MERTGRRGTVVSAVANSAGCYRLNLDLKTTPLVSIIISTAGRLITRNGLALDLLKNCISKIVQISSYPNIEIVVVHDLNISCETQDFLKEVGVELVLWHGHHADIAGKYDFGATAANGKFFLFMGDSIEPINGDWIERMVEHFEKPNIGVVGAKLLQENGMLQNAGTIIVNGRPRDALEGQTGKSNGYFFNNTAPRNVFSISSYCFMTSKNLHKELNGFDDAFSCLFFELDYCIRARRAGLNIVFTPFSELVHLEKRQGAQCFETDALQKIVERWPEEFSTDPYFCEKHLNVVSVDYRESFNRRRT